MTTPTYTTFMTSVVGQGGLFLYRTRDSLEAWAMTGTRTRQISLIFLPLADLLSRERETLNDIHLEFPLSIINLDRGNSYLLHIVFSL